MLQGLPRRVRAAAARSETLRTAYHRSQDATRAVRSIRAGFSELPPERAVDMAYEILLHREPDPIGRRNALAMLASGASNLDLADSIRASSEFHRMASYSGPLLGYSLHSSRCQFMRSLPPAKVIVDLGGTDLGSADGAMVTLGYPYHFDRLTIIDLPSDERHDLYKQSSASDTVETRLGPVHYRYHSMTDLSGFEDSSVDLVYSGQSIEHVTPDDGRHVLEQVTRILRPGGHIALDTPNGRVTRLQQDAFIDPDHEVEYTIEELTGLVEKAGLEIVEVKGANYAGASLAAGVFDPADVAGNDGLYWDAASCYLLCVVARRPL